MRGELMRAGDHAPERTARNALLGNPRTRSGVGSATVQDPYQVQVATTRLSRLAGALDVVDAHADLNHRYRRLITDSRQSLAAEEIRLTQARGIAKKLMVLVKAAGTGFADGLDAADREALEAGLAQADELVYADDA